MYQTTSRGHLTDAGYRAMMVDVKGGKQLSRDERFMRNQYERYRRLSSRPESRRLIAQARHDHVKHTRTIALWQSTAKSTRTFPQS